MSGLWYVKLPDGDVEPLSLDDLDEAFQAGHVDENSMVLAAGATQWARLGDLAGLDQPAAQAPPPRMMMAPVMPMMPVMPSSLRPVSVDLSEVDDDDLSFRPRKKSRAKWVVGVALVAGVVGVAGFEAQRAGVVSISRLLSKVSPSAAAAVVTEPVVAPPPALPPAASPPAPPPPPAADPAPAPAPAPAASDSVANRFSQDQRERLATADKQHDAKTRAHAKGHAAAAVSVHSSASKSKVQGFTTGGSKYDPLNATIP